MQALSEKYHSVKLTPKIFFLISLQLIVNYEYQARISYCQLIMTTINEESFSSNTQLILPNKRTKSTPINELLIVQSFIYSFIQKITY